MIDIKEARINHAAPQLLKALENLANKLKVTSASNFIDLTEARAAIIQACGKDINDD